MSRHHLTVNTELIAAILHTAGIQVTNANTTGTTTTTTSVDANHNHDDPKRERTSAVVVIDSMEAWLGLRDDTYMGLTVEDCLPLDPSIFVMAAQLFVQGWSGGGAAGGDASTENDHHPDEMDTQNSSTSTATATTDTATTFSPAPPPSSLFAHHHHRNPFLDTSLSPEEITLEAVLPSILVTKWLVTWMECNLVPHDDESHAASSSSSSSSLIQRLLLAEQPQQQQHGNTADTNKYNAFVRALYQHVQELPILQSHFHRYTQSLRQQQPSAHGNNTKNIIIHPQQRLQQYARAQQTATRLEAEFQTHLERLQVVLGAVYWVGNTDVRKQCRRHLGRVWADYYYNRQSAAGSGGTTPTTTASIRQENTSAAGIRITLQLLHRIVQGIGNTTASVVDDDKDDKDKDDTLRKDTSPSNTLPQAYQQLLIQHLVPLHQPNAMVLWRDQTSVLELYHEPLTQCIGVLLQKEPSWMAIVVPALVEVFPKVGNTPKQVLMLHELDTYVGLLEKIKENDNNNNNNNNMDSILEISGWKTWWPPLRQVVTRCMASDHSRVSERALSFFKNKMFVQLLQNSYSESLPLFLRSLVKREAPWNPTVRKQSFHVLEDLQKMNEPTFVSICNQLYGDERFMERPPQQESRKASSPDKSKPQMMLPKSTRQSAVPVNDFSLRAGMGSWKPPSQKSAVPGQRGSAGRVPTGRKQPPLTVTGVAPWAMSAPPSKASTPKFNANPPLTVTGVAPWAMRSSGTAPTSQRQRIEGMESVRETSTPPNETQSHSSGYHSVLTYMNKIKPSEEETGFSSWSKNQLAETPTLLPDLKFHDLVFGHELGTGAFSTVKYARMIDRSKTRSQWAEYAVKVCTLCSLSLPFLCRLEISSLFSYRCWNRSYQRRKFTSYRMKNLYKEKLPFCALPLTQA